MFRPQCWLSNWQPAPPLPTHPSPYHRQAHHMAKGQYPREVCIKSAGPVSSPKLLAQRWGTLI